MDAPGQTDIPFEVLVDFIFERLPKNRELEVEAFLEANPDYEFVVNGLLDYCAVHQIKSPEAFFQEFENDPAIVALREVATDQTGSTQKETAPVVRSLRSVQGRRWIGIAASVVLLVACGYLFFGDFFGRTNPAQFALQTYPPHLVSQQMGTGDPGGADSMNLILTAIELQEVQKMEAYIPILQDRLTTDSQNVKVLYSLGHA
ncbi:MAG: hypothetical protein KDC44_25360, partial [Phaeodactylibacter sp.]|nr:hypothetical protein [Phaeodactylibacter sp.]